MPSPTSESDEDGFVFVSADRVVEAMRELTAEPLPEAGSTNGTSCINSACTNNRCSNGLLCRNTGCTRNRRKCDVETEPSGG
jgi:hypothetical protein